MASRMREDPLIKIHSESSKEHHIEASTCLTMIFERVIKAVPPPLRPDLHTSYSLGYILKGQKVLNDRMKLENNKATPS